MRNLSSRSNQTLDKELFTAFHELVSLSSHLANSRTCTVNVTETCVLLFITYIYYTDFLNISCKEKAKKILPPDLCAPQLFGTVPLTR